MTAPSFPAGVAEDTALPYRLWEVLDLVDGTRSLDDVARLSGLTVPEVQARLAEVPEWLGRATQHSAPLNDAVIEELTRALTSVVGPVAALMVDDAVDDLGDGATLSGVLSGLMSELSPAQAPQFARALRERGLV